jgi:hypothetical protein
MDMRSGTLYGSYGEAIRAGVPVERAVEVEKVHDGEIVRVTKGIFKGRFYQRQPGGGVKRLFHRADGTFCTKKGTVVT